jgi:hypothetical protein
MVSWETHELASQSARLIAGSHALVVSSADLMARSRARAFSTMAAILRSRQLLYGRRSEQGGLIGASDIPMPAGESRDHDRRRDRA